MSLVERALSKLQQSRGHEASAAPREGVPPGVGPSAPPPRTSPAHKARGATRSGRVIEFNSAAIRAAGLLPPEHQERQIADQYRQIKRPLLATARQPLTDEMANPHLIMVSSAMPGDGKTFTAFNLALSFAKERDFEIVLVDADVGKPHISRLLGLAGEPGLLDALRNESIDVESLILRTSVPGLSVLPAGSRSETANELLASARMREVVRLLPGEDRSRIVVIDSPPLLLTNESRVLAEAIGQIVVVVRAGKTSQRDLLAALGYLDSSRRAVGLVLNQSLNPPSGSSYYGYGDGSHEPQSGT